MNGENVACHSAKSARAMVVYWVRYWFRERRYGGPHWRQIKDPDFRSAGIGVTRTAGGRHAPRRQLLRTRGGLIRLRLAAGRPPRGEETIEELLHLEDPGAIA